MEVRQGRLLCQSLGLVDLAEAGGTARSNSVLRLIIENQVQGRTYDEERHGWGVVSAEVRVRDRRTYQTCPPGRRREWKPTSSAQVSLRATTGERTLQRPCVESVGTATQNKRSSCNVHRAKEAALTAAIGSVLESVPGYSSVLGAVAAW
jgi:hypothetical protein